MTTPSIQPKRRWDLLPLALAYIQRALCLPEMGAFDVLTGLIFEGRVSARGPWPRGGIADQPRPQGHEHILPADQFRFATLTNDGEGVTFMGNSPPLNICWVEINMEQLRGEVIESMPPPASAAATTEPIAPAVESKDTKIPKPRKRGKPAVKTPAIEAAMRQMDRAELAGMKEEAMVANFNASRDICRKARKHVLSENVGN